MPNQVDRARCILMPEIHHEDKESAVDIIEVDFLTCFGIAHDQSNAWRWSDGTAVLSLATSFSAERDEGGTGQ